MCELPCRCMKKHPIVGVYLELRDEEYLLFSIHQLNTVNTCIFGIGTVRSGQTMQTLIRLLQKEQSDQGLHCLPFHRHLF